MYAFFCFFFFKQKTAYEMRISDWSSGVCSSDLFVTLALSGSALLSAGAAHAQFGGIVHDPTSFARQLQELNEARKVVQQSAQQLDEARALYRDLNKMTDIGNVANQLKNDVLRTSNVSSSSLDGYTSGDLNVVGGIDRKSTRLNSSH